MVSVFHRYIVSALASLLLLSSPGFADATSTSSTTARSNSPAPTCEFRTINYITDTLPQQCGKLSWSSGNLTSPTAGADNVNAAGEARLQNISDSSREAAHGSIGSLTVNSASADVTSSSSSPANPTESTEAAATDLDSGELNEAAFLSFEEWKKQTLEKAGQTNANIGNRRSGTEKKESESFQNNLDSIGDEGEINLDFGVFRSGAANEDSSDVAKTQEAEALESVKEAGRQKDQYRSKDAGRTCKERFSYASFDAGATILKTHPGAKNSKAVLVENKDSYMLSECAAQNKYLIIELSEDIWIDTVVIANYEFFSSMIRTFRVSSSDRYPIKMDKWKDLGTYEARNSRDIQAFLIENPQIWARYLRIEFLTHYGNEYYCPLSLVRVHGTRMLESWKETEAASEEEEDAEESEQTVGENVSPEANVAINQEDDKKDAQTIKSQAATTETAAKIALISADKLETPLDPVNTSETLMSPRKLLPLEDLFYHHTSNQTLEFCHISESPITPPAVPASTTLDVKTLTTTLASDKITIPPTTAPPPQSVMTSSLPNQEEASSKEAVPDSKESSVHSSPVNSTQANSEIQPSTSSIVASAMIKQQNSTIQKNKTSATSSGSPALPTIQESFFKAVSRRLQLLESNSTLSLKYIEEQSKILREAFSKVEKKQLQKTNTFLDHLNSTVLTELRSFRQQYDEIWQSTIISLEGQREESRKEILAISTRLNVLADEVVFQKRMSIIQSVLLLLCLGLVIFSRVSSSGIVDLHAIQSRARAFGIPLSPLVSRPESPQFENEDQEPWLEGEDRGELSDGSPISREEREGSPPTPISAYSRAPAITPPAVDDLLDPVGTFTSADDYLEVPSHLRPNSNKNLPLQNTYDTMRRTPEKQLPLIPEPASPPTSGADESDLVNSIASPESQSQAWNGYSQEELDDAAGRTFPSPPPESQQAKFTIVSKPLPALPPEHDGDV